MEINMNNNLINEQEVVQPQNQITFQNQQEIIEKESEEFFSYIRDYLIDQLLGIKENNKLKNSDLEEILEQILAERKIYKENEKTLDVLQLEHKRLKDIKARIEGLYKIYLAYEQKDDFEDKSSF